MFFVFKTFIVCNFAYTTAYFCGNELDFFIFQIE